MYLNNIAITQHKSQPSLVCIVIRREHNARVYSLRVETNKATLYDQLLVISSWDSNIDLFIQMCKLQQELQSTEEIKEPSND